MGMLFVILAILAVIAFFCVLLSALCASLNKKLNNALVEYINEAKLDCYSISDISEAIKIDRKTVENHLIYLCKANKFYKRFIINRNTEEIFTLDTSESDYILVNLPCRGLFGLDTRNKKFCYANSDSVGRVLDFDLLVKYSTNTDLTIDVELDDLERPLLEIVIADKNSGTNSDASAVFNRICAYLDFILRITGKAPSLSENDSSPQPEATPTQQPIIQNISYNNIVNQPEQKHIVMIEDRLAKLRELLYSGEISEEDYDIKKKKIIDEL